MSHKRPPPGREFKPKGSILGTQAHRAVNLGFLAGVAGTVVISALLWPYLKDVTDWIRSFDDKRDQNIEWQMTQARLQAIRLAKKKREDPYFNDTERRKRLGLEQNASIQAKELNTADIKMESKKADHPVDKQG